MRLLLWNFCKNAPDPAHINEISTNVFGALDDAAWLYREAFGFDPCAITVEQSLKLRPYAYTFLRHKAAWSGAIPLVKTHCANGYLAPSQAHPFINWEEIHSAAVIVRNPLDVCPSWAHHLGKTVDETADLMGQQNFTVRRDDTFHYTMLDSWSMWVKSWMQPYCSNKVTLVRYEEMDEQFPGVLRFFDFEESSDTARADRAIKHTALSTLRRMEQEDGFAEASAKAGGKGFFGGEREPLTDYARQKIISDHGETMELLGYATS